LRVVRDGADTPQHFVYHGDRIMRFKITSYVYGGLAGTDGHKVRVFVSGDAHQWQEVDVAKETTATKEGWARAVLTPAKDLASPAAYLKIELRGDAAIYSPQVGEVRLFTVGAPVR
jgi:hypothetical protein